MSRTIGITIYKLKSIVKGNLIPRMETANSISEYFSKEIKKYLF